MIMTMESSEDNCKGGDDLDIDKGRRGLKVKEEVNLRYSRKMLILLYLQSDAPLLQQPSAGCGRARGGLMRLRAP